MSTTNYPARPSEYEIHPGHGFLKGLPNLAPMPTSGVVPQGMTNTDLELAMDWGWDIVIGLFAVQFDVDDWDVDPPPAIYYIWALIASATFVRMGNEENRVRTSNQLAPTDRWMQQAESMAMDFKKRKRQLLKRDGTLLMCRDDMCVPEVRSSTSRFFPDLDTETSHGLTASGSTEEVYKFITRRARTS